MYETHPLPLWVIPLFPLFFIGMWMAVVGGLAAIGGWSEMAELYRAPEAGVRGGGRSFRMASVDLRRGAMPLPVNYSSCMAATVSGAGLYMRPAFFFRFRHPPLLIP